MTSEGSDSGEEEQEESEEQGGFKGTKIYKISRDLEDLNYHLASVFPSFTSQATAIRSKPKEPNPKYPALTRDPSPVRTSSPFRPQRGTTPT